MMQGVDFRWESEIDRVRVRVGDEQELFKWSVRERGYQVVQMMDTWVMEGVLGKLTFEEFLEDLSTLDDVEYLKEMYEECVRTHDKLTRLFGDYEEKWNVEERRVQ